jgi:hypothetical protein
MKHRHFRDVKRSTLGLAPEPDPERVGLVVSGNPDVLKQAHDVPDFAQGDMPRQRLVSGPGWRESQRSKTPVQHSHGPTVHSSEAADDTES